MSKHNLLQEGDIIELNGSHQVYAKVPRHFAYTDRKGDFSMTRAAIHLSADVFDYLRGKYIVVHTELSGGSTGRDSYPNGHFVKCESVDGRFEVSFYQTGCFTVINPDVPVIGKAKKKWIVDC